MIKKLIEIIKDMFFGVNMSDQNWYNDPRVEETVIKKPIEKKVYWPQCNHKITSPYGWRTIMGGSQFHNGVDTIGKKDGSTDWRLRAVCDMTITQRLQPDLEYPSLFIKKGKRWTRRKEPNNRKGMPYSWTSYLVAKATIGRDEYSFIYRHGNYTKRPGALVKAGADIGIMGNFGYSFLAHLHFEVWKNGIIMDPELFFKKISKKFEVIK